MKGSFINKLIIIPIVFFLQWLYPPATSIILIIGGFYLAYEGMEKIIEFLFHRNKKGHEVLEEADDVIENGEDTEQVKVKSAITTDFILSLEIVIIALASAKDGYESLKSQFNPLAVEIITVSIVSIIATIGVYGIVALIVRMDDAGYKLIKKSNEQGFWNLVGETLVKALPIVIKVLGIIGTIALILVAGGIFDHNIGYLHHILTNIPAMAKQALLGIIGGLITIPIVGMLKKGYALIKK